MSEPTPATGNTGNPGSTSPRDDDASTIVAGLSLEQKVRLLSGRDHWHLEAVASVGLPAIMVTDGPHGLRKQAGSGDHLGLGESVPATCFPTAVGLAATFDEDLLTEIGAALGRECQAEDVGVLLGPGLNIKRHPAGGRNFEYFSEDPIVSGRLAAALVRGVQSQGVGACLKHFAANHQETFRMVIDTIVDQRTLRELELTGFELAVQGSRPWSVMTGYNQLNGTFCSDDHWLLTEVLRDSWGFDGLVMTDWGGMNDRVAATRAGCDLEMPGGGDAFDAELIAAVRRGELDEAAIDVVAARIVELIIRVRANARPDATADLDAHHDLARRAAADATVLLANDGILPLAADTLGSVAVIGSFAVSPRFQGAGSSQVRPTRLDAALPALRERLGGTRIDYAPGYEVATGTTTSSLVTEAAAAAAGADVAVVFVGLPASYESEGFDRQHLGLPAGHTRLIEAVLDANPRTVVVLTNGAPVELPWADRAAALLEGYLGGQAGGSAIVDVLVGDREPGGRLAESFPVRGSDLAADANFPGHPKQVEHREGLLVGYRFHDTAGVPARFPFGHGLGYTTFELTGATCRGEGTDRTVSVEVVNTGDRAGATVVQLYVRDVEASVPRPAKELKAFAKVRLDPGERTGVELDLDRRSFAFWDVGVGDWVVESGAFELLVGTSSTDIHHRIEVAVESDDAVTPAPATTGPIATDAEFTAMLGHPVPVPRAVQPFDRNTTVADLATTSAGRRLQTLILREGAKRTDAGTAEGDDATRRMFEAVIRQAPLRSLPLLGGGTPPLSAIDAAIDTLNGEPGLAVRRTAERLRAWADRSG